MYHSPKCYREVNKLDNQAKKLFREAQKMMHEAFNTLEGVREYRQAAIALSADVNELVDKLRDISRIEKKYQVWFMRCQCGVEQ